MALAYRHESGRDHPRACGEHTDRVYRLADLVGSSPRLRGTLSNQKPTRANHGIIPALAGNTNLKRPKPRKRWDHPRACGEHLATSFVVCECGGSSPRLRGTRMAETAHHRPHGIIPALAGNTSEDVAPAWAARDHPRACGEHHPPAQDPRRRQGSSPRLRGTRGPTVPTRLAGGIIPALAGNTFVGSRKDRRNRDHPRACGEHPERLFRDGAE